METPETPQTPEEPQIDDIISEVSETYSDAESSPPESPPEEPQYSDLQREAIDQYGLPESLVSRVEDDAELTNLLTAWDRNALQSAAPQQPMQPPQQQQPYTQAYPPQQYAPPQPPPQQDWQQPPTQTEPFKIELSEDVDPSIRGAIEGLHKHYETQLQQQQQQLQAYFLQQQQEEAAEFAGWFDNAVDGLGDVYSSVLGKGQIAPNSPQDYARQQLMQVVLQFGGMTPNASREDALRRAVRYVHGNLQQEHERRALAEKLKSRANGSISRPTHREPGSLEKGELRPDGLFQQDYEEIKALANQFEQGV
jgi:hypothetical protein